MAGEGSLSMEAALTARKVKGAWTLKRLLYLLDSLAAYDIQMEKKRKKFAWAAGMSALGAFVAFMLWVFLEFETLGYAAAVLAMLFGVTMIIKISYSRKDLPNDFREYLIPLLRMLSGDIVDKSKIALNMDIAQLKDKKYSKGATSLPPRAPYHKMTLERFERPLLTMAIQLHDGNRLLMERSESLTVITKKKKNPRGKIKTKEKSKKRVFTRMKLAVNAKAYSVRKTIARPAGAQVSAKAGANRITIDMKLAEKGGENVGGTPESTLRQIAFLYSCITPSRKGGDNVQ